VDTRIDATFFPLPAGWYPLTVTLAGTGRGVVQVLLLSTSPSGGGTIACGLYDISQTYGDCGGRYYGGTLLELDAAPNRGSTFTGWGGACAGAGTSARCRVTIQQAMDVMATFTQIP
jgi:hypothetical protein